MSLRARLVLVLVLVLLFVLVTACAPQVPRALPAQVVVGTVDGGPIRAEKPEKPEREVGLGLELGARHLRMQGTELPLKPTPADFVARLGKPSRIVSLASRIHVYDALGVILYEDHGSDRITDMTVLFARQPWEFMPETTFRGAVRIGSQRVDGTTAYATLDSGLGELWGRKSIIGDTVARVRGQDVYLSRAPDHADRLGSISITFAK